MKKIFTLVAALFCIATTASAQTFDVDSQVINLGVGIGGSYGTPIAVSYEKGFYDLGNDQVIGIGGYLGYASSSEDFTYGEFKYSNIFIAVAANYHYTAVSNFDLYGGVRLGYNVASASTEWYDAANEATYGGLFSASSGGFIYTVHAGARYYVSDKFAINAELGHGVSTLTLGISYKL